MDTMKLIPYIQDERLREYAANCARTMRSDSTGSGKKEAAELRKCRLEIERCHTVLQHRYGGAAHVPPACEWLLDNRYMIQREYPSVFTALRQSKNQRISRDGLIIIELCRALLQAGHGNITAERCSIFLGGFQEVTVLQRRELRLFPAALSCVIIEYIASVCSRLIDSSDPGSSVEDMAALFNSLRLLSVIDMDEILESADISGAILADDPTGHYKRMDRVTVMAYLDRLELLAKKRGIEEQVLARELIDKACSDKRHIGFYLFPAPGKAGSALYIGANILLTMFISLCLAFGCGSAAYAFLLVIPVWSLVKGLADFILLRLIKPSPLPRLDMKDGIPEEGKTICVISALLGCCEVNRLEELRLAGQREGKNLQFGLLADLPTSSEEETPDDAKLLKDAEDAVKSLNGKYGGGFFLFTRKRSFDGEGYSGHERKRGALLELAKLLCGEASELNVAGDADALCGTRYIISLDADTRIYPGSLGELVGAALHPLNTPVIDEKSGVVRSGHAIIHPRIENELGSANATDFALIFAGFGGSDPYGSLCGELCMDAFDCGGFAGKGLMDARALLRCTGSRFPEGRILSHDALEGAYLRGAYMSDVEFSDSFPSVPLAYFKRQHRWIRGDWQNARWITAKELSAMDRFRLFDSLIRSLTAPLTLDAILAGFFIQDHGLKLAALAALLSLLRDLMMSMAEGSLKRRQGTRLRRHTRLLSGFGGAIVRTFTRLWLLPFEAWISLTAILTALWRMLISKSKLLQWQTSAQTGGSFSFNDHVRSMWVSVVLGVVLMGFSPEIIGKASGFLWLLTPAAASALALPAQKEQELSVRDRDMLCSAALDAWGYLRDLSSEEDHFLPPDNFQQQPPVGAAHRTSPTNIGLAAASAAALGNSGLIARSEAAEYISKLCGTLELMPRYSGHYYNWYDTRTLSPLQPPFISTVDSGNMYAGLLTAAAALEAWGETELCKRLNRLMDGMDFSLFYDSTRELLYICYDTLKERGAGGWYDLMASEAMLTSYIAAAKGDVPLRHWRRLSRAQLQKDGYRGLASWTGTMFEYLMPALFLPIYRSSLLYESDRFCLYVQKRRHFPGKPWGISESAFYSLDASLSYRYKAHGCPELALKRGQEADMVISPYSSFLALAADSQSAAKNLRRLKELGAYGRWGFIEALDFTPDRCSRSDGEPVHCWMAHHVSMSILAAVNELDGGSVRKLFMSSPDMAAHTLLLQEKLPDGAVLIRRGAAEIPERPGRVQREAWSVRGGRDVAPSRACLLSNGVYSMRLKNSGESAAFLGEVCIYRADRQSPGLCLKLGSETIFPHEASEMWELGESQCRWSDRINGYDFSLTRQTAEGELGERITLSLSCPREAAAMVELGFAPVLALLRDWDSHSAYWKLGIHAEIRDGRLLLHRLSKGNSRELWLCAACSMNAEYSAGDNGQPGFLSSPRVRVRIPLRIRPGKSSELTFALSVGGTAAEALDAAERILVSPAAGNMVGAAAKRLGMSRDEVGAAMDYVLPLWENSFTNASPKRELWKYGVSGDLPIICCDGRAAEAESLLRAFCLLKSCGMEADLLFFSDEHGEYIQPIKQRMYRLLSAAGLEALIGCPGGVRTVSRNAFETVQSRAAVSVGTDRTPLPSLRHPALSAERTADFVPLHRWKDCCFEYFTDKALGARTWQHIISNGNLGAFASDFGPSGLWLKNAREMRLIPPQDDISGTVSHEWLYTVIDGKSVSLFSAGDGMSCSVSYGPGFARWKKELGDRTVETLMFIPRSGDARILLISGAAGLALNWEIEPVVGAEDSACVKIEDCGDYAVISNPECYLPDVRMLVGASVPCRFSDGYAPPALKTELTAEGRTVLVCGCITPDELQIFTDPVQAETLYAETEAYWASLLGRFSLKCGIPALEHYMNGWAVYQTVACRLMGRSSIYQSGGAVGFRDQLQDCVNMLLIDSALARSQILDCCRHQYEEGDVMHWWHSHPDGDKGVRTRCSDDLLWLVWALCEYTDASGDYELCKLEVPFIRSAPLSGDEHDRYEVPTLSLCSDTVAGHARAALDCCISRGFGEHGLPYMGSGDWNDGLDRVGGESVWLGWFLSHCAHRFSVLLERLGDEDAGKYEELSEKVGKAADSSFNGQWYARFYCGDGSDPGCRERIDSISQSWAELCPWGSEEKKYSALSTALLRLTDREHRIVKLLDPPYSADRHSPGYISGYGEGYRENGGQYTHGAVWLAMAAFRQGRNDEAWEIMNMLLPENHELSRYEAEPFVLPADVCSSPGREGLAGWTWYTGSAGWYFRVIAQEMLGLKLKDGRLLVEAHLPSCLRNYEVRWTDEGGAEHTVICSSDHVTVDGREQPR